MKVKVISIEGYRVLVEWLEGGDYHRASITRDQIKNDEVSIDDLHSAIQIGYPWDEQTFDTKNMSYELHRRGIWTPDDARSNPRAVQEAVISASQSVVTRILGG